MDEKPITPEQAEELLKALRTCAFELMTLVPRLSGKFQQNAQACVNLAREKAIAAGRKL